MSQFSAEVQQCIDNMQKNDRYVVEAAANYLLAMNTSESQTALCSMLATLQKYSSVYWSVIRGLGIQQVLDTTTYYEKVLLQETNNDNYALQLSALNQIGVLGEPLDTRLLFEALFYQTNERIAQIILSLLFDLDTDYNFYLIVLIMRCNLNSAVQRAISKQIVPRFDADKLLPLILGLIYTETTHTDVRNTALALLWQCVTQGKIDGYEAQVVLALQYCMYNLPDLGVMPYRCLMEINTPEAKAALSQWDMDSKHGEMQFFR